MALRRRPADPYFTNDSDQLRVVYTFVLYESAPSLLNAWLFKTPEGDPNARGRQENDCGPRDGRIDRVGAWRGRGPRAGAGDQVDGTLMADCAGPLGSRPSWRPLEVGVRTGLPTFGGPCRHSREAITW